MSNPWIEINGEKFYLIEFAIQQSLAAHAQIELSLDIVKYPTYKDKILNLFDTHSVFEMKNESCLSLGCLIKNLDITNNKISVSIRCDLLKIITKSERREELIEELLNNQNNLNIN